MIEVGVGEEDDIDGGQILDPEPGAFQAFEEEQPVREVRVDEDVEVGELEEERGMADPGDGDFPGAELGGVEQPVLPPPATCMSGRKSRPWWIAT